MLVSQHNSFTFLLIIKPKSVDLFPLRAIHQTGQMSDLNRKSYQQAPFWSGFLSDGLGNSQD